MSEIAGEIFRQSAGYVYTPYVGITGGSYIPVCGETYDFTEVFERHTEIRDSLNPAVTDVR